MRLLRRQRRSTDFDPVEISERKGVRYLHLGGSAVQSAMRIRDPYALELEYTRAMMAFLLFKPAPRNIVLIGLGGGSVAKFIHRKLPGARLAALEVNPDVAAAARSLFMLPPDDDRLSVVLGDGVRYVAGLDRRTDVLLADGYDGERIVEAPASPAFYANCLRGLAPGGVAVFNLWGSDRFFDVYRDRVAQAFAGHTLILPAEKKGNIQVFAFKPPLPHAGFARLQVRARSLEAGLGLEMPVFVERMKQCNPASEHGFRI